MLRQEKNGAEVIVLNDNKVVEWNEYRKTVRTFTFKKYYTKISFKIKKTKTRISKLWQVSTLQNIFLKKPSNKSNNEL